MVIFQDWIFFGACVNPYITATDIIEWSPLISGYKSLIPGYYKDSIRIVRTHLRGKTHETLQHNTCSLPSRHVVMATTNANQAVTESKWYWYHYSDVIIGAMASQITSLTIVYSTVCSGADQRKHQSSASLAFARGIHRWPVNSPYKGPVTRNFFHLMTSWWF